VNQEASASVQYANEAVALLASIQHLKLLPRTGWFFAGITQPESVAEHSFVATWVAILLAEQVNQSWESQGLATPLDLGKIMQIALVHDLAESVLTDLPKRSTDLIGKAVKYQAEATVLQQLFQQMPNGDRYVACWQEYADGATPEARLVRDADKLEMIHQALCYEQGGQRNVGEFWQEQLWHYPASQSLVEELQRLRLLLDRPLSNHQQP
jgi:putative hydrolases of HD superfamily